MLNSDISLNSSCDLNSMFPIEGSTFSSNQNLIGQSVVKSEIKRLALSQLHQFHLFHFNEPFNTVRVPSLFLAFTS